MAQQGWILARRLGLANGKDGNMYKYRLLAETITRACGETVAGSHGVMDRHGNYVPMDGTTGRNAARVLRRHTQTVDTVDALADIATYYDAIDHVDVRGDDEAILYLATVGRKITDDEPYVRAVAVEGPDVVREIEYIANRTPGTRLGR